MRTIKRKRIFGGKKSIHKKKHKRSLKKFRGGVELNYLTPNQEIYKVKGILGYQKPGTLYKDEGKYTSLKIIEDIEVPTTPNLFKGNIKHDNGNVILTDYKSLKSIKIGWIYGGHFGNIVIYSSNNELKEVKDKMNKFLFVNDKTIHETLFVRKIDEEVINFCGRKKELINEISPWRDMTQEFDVEDSDLNDRDIDTMFKSLLEKYYEEKTNGISKEKIKVLLDSVQILDIDIPPVRKSDLLNKYKNILQRRNKSFVKEFSTEYISDTIPTEKWDSVLGTQIDDSTNYPDIYKEINALRLKQEMIYKELTDIFSTHNKEIIPFNIEYFLYDVNPNPKSNELIDRVIQKFKQVTPKFNNRCYKCISKIMYILQIFNPSDKIYRAADIVRYKTISNSDLNKIPIKIAGFFDSAPLLPGFRDFMNGYVINSLIDPVIMARLLSFNIQIKATILLSCSSDDNKKNTYNGTQFNELTGLDIHHTNKFYTNINDDELRLKIKRLKINNDKEITDKDLEDAKKPGGEQSKVTELVKVLDGNGNTAKSIECDLEVPLQDPREDVDPIIKLNCKCKIYRKDVGKQTDIMIYLFDKDEQSNFSHELINVLLDKTQQNDAIYTIEDEYLKLFDEHLLGDKDGHEQNYYDLIL